WPLAGFHLVRGPILPAVADIFLPDVIGRYHECLARGDVAGIVQQFAPSGGLRKDGDVAEVHSGATELSRLFTVLFANGGGLVVEHSTYADDGASCALVYLATTCGRSALPHQAAAAVY